MKLPSSRTRTPDSGPRSWSSWPRSSPIPPAACCTRTGYRHPLPADNLPYYSRDIHLLFGGDDAWGAWARRWTAEEGRHSMAIYGYLMVTRAIDPIALERGRMCQVSTAQVPAPVSPSHGLVYLTLQELATRIAHRNTGKMLGDPVGYDLMARVASDENLHHLFYRDLTSAAFE